MKWLDGKGNGLLPWRSRFKSWWKLPCDQHCMLTICIYNVFMRNINWNFWMNIKFKFQINTKTYFGARKISLLEVGNWLKNLLMGEAKVFCHQCWRFKDEELIANLWSNNLSIFFSIWLNFSSIWSIRWPIRATSITTPSTFAFVNSWFMMMVATTTMISMLTTYLGSL